MRFPPTCRRGWVVAALLLVLPVTAGAHTVVGGAGPYFNGVLHPFTVPAHLLVLLGLGLLAGQHAPLNVKTPLAVFVPVSGLALALTTTGLVPAVYPPILISISLLVGLLVALEKPLPRSVCQAIYGGSALALGLDSVVESGAPLEIAKTLLGTWTGLILAVADVAYYSSLFTKWPWQKVGLRVMGSWLTAASLMILAFAIRHA